METTEILSWINHNPLLFGVVFTGATFVLAGGFTLLDLLFGDEEDDR